MCMGGGRVEVGGGYGGEHDCDGNRSAMTLLYVFFF